MTKHRITAVLGTLAAAALLVGCGGGHSAAEPDHQHHDRSLYQHTDGTEANTDTDDSLAGADLKQLATASDLVVRGKIVKATKDVLLAKGDPTAKYTVFTTRVTDTVRGAQAKEIDFALLTELSGAPIVVEQRQTPGVGSDVILVLTKIAPEFGHDGYVLTNQSGLLVVNKNGTVASGLEDSSPVSKQTETLRTATQVLAELRSAG